jgi:hypothetical protein
MVSALDEEYRDVAVDIVDTLFSQRSGSNMI